jgi:hypothetical protein
VRWLGAALASLLAAHVACAQLDATPLQHAVIAAHLRREIASARGDAAARASAEVELAERRAGLEAALAAGGALDLEGVRAEVERQLADVEARLDEIGERCGPIADPRAGRARRDALRAVREALARGPFLPR